MRGRRDVLSGLGAAGLAALLAPAVGRADRADKRSGSAGVRPSGKADAVTVAGLTFVFLTDAKLTGGKLSVVEVFVAPKAGAPPHVHAKYDESFYVLEGAFEVALGGRKEKAKAGDFVHIPGGTVHAFTNTGGKLARILSTSTPAGLEDFFRAVGHKVEDRAKPKPLTPEDAKRMVEVGKKYGVEIRKP